MADGISVGVADSILNSLCTDTAWTPPVAFYVQLHTGAPGAAGTSNVAGESTREAATFGSASAGSSTTTANTVWTNVSTAETYTDVSFWSAVTGGTFLGSSVLTTPRTVAVGDDFTIPSGDLTVSLTPIAA